MNRAYIIIRYKFKIYSFRHIYSVLKPESGIITGITYAEAPGAEACSESSRQNVQFKHIRATRRFRPAGNSSVVL